MPRNVILAASLPASADRLYDMYLDPRDLAAFTGAAVTIAPRRFQLGPPAHMKSGTHSRSPKER